MEIRELQNQILQEDTQKDKFLTYSMGEKIYERENQCTVNGYIKSAKD